MQKILYFLKYNNSIPFIFGIVFVSSGVALAANPDVRENLAEIIITSEEKVKSIDNTFIIDIDLDSFTPTVQITNVTEDGENYYISYTLRTIDIDDSSWNIVSQQKKIVVSMALLGNEDLGIYVAEEMKEVTDRQLSYLKEVQMKERKGGKTQKVVSTTYSGLIGKYLDPKEEFFVGYELIVKPSNSTIVENISEKTNVETNTVLVTTSQTQIQQQNEYVATVISVSTISGSTMIMIGNNPAKVPTNSIGSSYSDNGVRAKNNAKQDLSISITVNGVSTYEVDIDTRMPGVHLVRYIAIDNDGNTLMLERTVIVYDRYKIVAPVIVILGDVIISSKVGEPYIDAGSIAIDYNDGDISENIIVENTVDKDNVGIYKVLYNVVDSDGNTTTATRIVNIIE